MKALAAVRTGKVIADAGAWKTGKMPATAFPLSKSASYRLGGTWHWRVLRLVEAGRTYRLLVAYEAVKRQYQAWLGLDCGGDQALIARLEYHASHHGWHCHWKTGDLDKVSRGVVKDCHPRERLKLCPRQKVFDKDNALSIAFDVFNVATATDGGML